MAVVDLLDLPAALPPYAPVIGLDLGEKTIGVAVSDATRAIASPLELIRKGKFTDDANRLFSLMESRGAKGVVIGLPVNMDGSEGPRCQSSRAFGRNLLRLRPELPIAFWDERLSTVAVQRMMTDEADLSRARRAELVDKMAAAYILQGALDRLGYAALMTPDEAYAAIEAHFLLEAGITRSMKRGFAEGGLMTQGKLFAIRRTTCC